MRKPKQECKGCRYITKCYSNKTSPRNIVINILACRIRKDIDRNESSKLFLEMVRPQLIKLVSRARNRVGNGYIDMEMLLADLESRVIECLLSEDGYKLGEPAYLTEYLFSNNPRTGWAKKWILWSFSKDHKFYKRHYLLGINPKSDSESVSDDDRSAILYHEIMNYHEPEITSDNAVQSIMNIINDGITLNANEYRVLSFCLAHTNDINKSRLIDGTHTYLSKVMKVSRPRITRLFATSKQKILRVVKERGIEL